MQQSVMNVISTKLGRQLRFFPKMMLSQSFKFIDNECHTLESMLNF